MAPPYQLGLLVALWLVGSPRAARARLLTAVGVLFLLQVSALFAAGEWANHFGVVPHVALVRGVSVLVVLALFAWLQAQFPGRLPQGNPPTVRSRHV